MTATDKLRRSLDEHDVNWSGEVLADCLIVTMWTDGETAYEFNELIDSNHAYLEMNINPCTPGEAIAAWNTRVLHGTLTVEHVKRIHEIIEKHWHDLSAEYDMPEAAALPEYSYDWQAIADELNDVWNSRADYHGYEQAAIEAWESIKAWNSRAERTCEFNIKDNMNETEGMGDVWIECSACNCVFDFYADEWLMKMNYCPNCGARRVGE